jgi:L-asparaginase
MMAVKGGMCYKYENLLFRRGGMYHLNSKVVFLTTGGTIEKTYDELEGTLMNRRSIIKQTILQKLRLPYTDVELVHVLATDSLDMTQEDRELLLEKIKEYQQKKCPMIILHGTDTMEVSARFVADSLGTPEFPIVFTGAMKPLGFIDSDAGQNVTEALMASKILPPGIYISFHNQVFPALHARKNRQLRTFEFVD